METLIFCYCIISICIIQNSTKYDLYIPLENIFLNLQREEMEVMAERGDG